jgi:hypothetical protein
MVWASRDTRRIRTEVFSTFAAEGRPPSPDELAAALRIGRDQVMSALRELHDAHAIVLTAAGDSIRMAHPFSAWPMGFVVRGEGDRLWWGGCAWDSFGIVAALGMTLGIETTCPSCGRELRYEAGPDEPPADNLVVRLPRPAREWWDDVVATCTHIRTFCSTEHVNEWRERVGAPAGTVVKLARLHRLAMPWYGDRLDPDWAPRPRERSQAILGAVGLTGPFWELP